MKRTTASTLMDPLRAVMGAGMSIGRAVRRFSDSVCETAPVVASGQLAGILSRSAALHASRMGGDELEVRDVIGAEAPRVGSRAGLPLVMRRSRGVAAGVIVTGPGGIVAGIIPRHRVAGVIPAPDTGSVNLETRMRALMGSGSVSLLKRAGALAVRRGERLHLAGGVVRDLLMGTVPRDLDLVVEGDGIGFAAEFARRANGELTCHERFGTAIVRLSPRGGSTDGGLRIDVATSRREFYAHPAALPLVEPGSILDDIDRRDVTINSMMVRLDGGRFGMLADETGGRSDIRRRTLRVIHKLSLVDDPTRAFRISRFAARFRFALHDDTKESLSLARRLGAFERLGGERLLREIDLITHEPEPERVLWQCHASGLLALVGPALRWNERTRRRVTKFFEGIRAGRLHAIPSGFDPVLMMLMLLSGDAPRTQRKALAARLKMAGRRAESVVFDAETPRSLDRALSAAPRPGRIVRLCERAEPETLVMVWSERGPAAKAIDWYLSELSRCRTTVTGEDLREMGLPAGPGYAHVLSRLRDALLEGRVRSAAAERKMALRLVAGLKRKR